MLPDLASLPVFHAWHEKGGAQIPRWSMWLLLDIVQKQYDSLIVTRAGRDTSLSQPNLKLDFSQSMMRADSFWGKIMKNPTKYNSPQAITQPACRQCCARETLLFQAQLFPPLKKGSKTTQNYICSQ